MSIKITRLLLKIGTALTFSTLLSTPVLAADVPSGLFLRGAESLGDFSTLKPSVPLEAPNINSGCNVGDGADSLQCGLNSDASGSSATALGANSVASGVGGIAVGNNADAVGALSTAMGIHANASGTGSNAIGLRADASGNFASAIGRNANASGTGTTAIGLDSSASGDYAQAFGRNSSANGAASLAMGTDSTASESNSIAIGKNANASFANSIAIGTGATATRTNQLMLGSATSTYTLAGVTSAASRGQQGAVVGLLTTDTNGNLASDGGAIQASIVDHEVRITGLEGDLNTTTQLATTNANDIANISGSGGTLQTAENTTNIATNAQNLATTSQLATTNSQRIASNATSITENAQRLDLAMGSILSNTDSIMRNTEEISELSSGLAAVSALPDMYLSPHAKWSAAGGVGMYGDDVGIGATLAVRAGRNFAIGASVASAGDKATGKLQVRYEGF